MKRFYSIGVDFGTESGRVVLVDVKNGDVAATSVTPYAHGVITGKLPYGDVQLGKQTVLQVPQDYMETLQRSIIDVLSKTGVSAEQIIGIGMDFTASTILPVTAEFIPLCELDEYKERPHAYVKLWKHHETEPQAKRLNALAQDEKWLKRYGGIISAEWMLPKVMEVAEQDPELFQKTDLFIEAGDWVAAKLTGRLVRNSCAAGYKGMWHKKDGFVSKDFLRGLDPSLADMYETKLRGAIEPPGKRAGTLSKEMAEWIGLREGIPVATGMIDAHAALPGIGVTEEKTMVIVMGTSSCHLLLSEKEEWIPGISGVVEDGILPGYFAYEAGQAAVGDLFAWFVNHQVPAYIVDEAEKEGMDLHGYLSKLASAVEPGTSGLIALDWANGCRTPWVDMSLSGVLIGQKLTTHPAEMYRAYLEASAFGTRAIVELFEKHGIQVERIVATGGIPGKNPLLMQIYADVLQREITVNLTDQAPALGAAILGAVAAGEEGGYEDIATAIDRMSSKDTIQYSPNIANRDVYDMLYDNYERLSSFFANESTIMHQLAALKNKRMLKKRMSDEEEHAW